MTKGESVGREVFQPIESFSTKVDGIDTSFTEDVTLVREGHPILKTHGHLFRPIRVHYDVESATASPGELRQR